MMAFAILDLAPALAIFRTKMISQDSEKPGRHVGTRLEGSDIRERSQQRFLHYFIGAVHVSTQGNRQGWETWHRNEDGFATRLVHRHYCESFFPPASRRLIRSLNRSGTPWFTTSSYMARSCWPRRACTSRPSLAGLLTLLLLVAVASIGFCCPTGFRSFIVLHPKFRGPGGRRFPLVLCKTVDLADGSS